MERIGTDWDRKRLNGTNWDLKNAINICKNSDNSKKLLKTVPLVPIFPLIIGKILININLFRLKSPIFLVLVFCI